MAAKKEQAVKDVVFSAEQMSVIQQMLEDTRKSTDSRRPDAVSMYNTRDPKKIETVNVKRIDGKFVIGFVNFQKDAFKKKPRYLVNKAVPERGLINEPHITLILSDGKDEEKKEMLLLDYVTQGKRDQYQAKVVNIEEKEVIEDHGILGATGEYAGEVDGEGKPLSRTKILAQTKRTERVFHVELPGFDKPVEFISDYLA